MPLTRFERRCDHVEHTLGRIRDGREVGAPCREGLLDLDEEIAHRERERYDVSDMNGGIEHVRIDRKDDRDTRRS